MKSEFDEVVCVWNLYWIWGFLNLIFLVGCLMIIYYFLEFYSVRGYMINVFEDRIVVCKSECKFWDDELCDVDIYCLCIIYMVEKFWVEFSNFDDVLILYWNLR